MPMRSSIRDRILHRENYTGRISDFCDLHGGQLRQSLRISTEARVITQRRTALLYRTIKTALIIDQIDFRGNFIHCILSNQFVTPKVSSRWRNVSEEHLQLALMLRFRRIFIKTLLIFGISLLVIVKSTSYGEKNLLPSFIFSFSFVGWKVL